MDTDLLKFLTAEGTFAILFSYLFIYMLKQNQTREEKYLSIIKHLSDTLDNILSLFEPQINKYGRLLENEDTKQDLILHFIKILDSLPTNKDIFFNNKIIFSYISKAIRNEYIRLSKKQYKIKTHEQMLEYNLDMQSTEFESQIYILDLFKVLTKNEKIIIKLLYINYLSVIEVSKYMKISFLLNLWLKNLK